MGAGGHARRLQSRRPTNEPALSRSSRRAAAQPAALGLRAAARSSICRRCRSWSWGSTSGIRRAAYRSVRIGCSAPCVGCWARRWRAFSAHRSDPEADGPYNPFTPEARIGVPVSPFPRWLRCPMCGRMGEVGSGLFELKAEPYRPDRTRFVHANCDKARGLATNGGARALSRCVSRWTSRRLPVALLRPRRPSDCPGPLRFFEQGASLQTENLWVRCERCDASRSMVDAFGDRGQQLLPKCRGRHPHLGRADASCDERLRPVLLGASNSWFPVTLTVLAIPTKGDKLAQLLADKSDLFSDVGSQAELGLALKMLGKSGMLGGLGEYKADEIWEALQALRGGGGGEEEPPDLKKPEWDAFTSPNPPQNWPDFMVTRIAAPKGLEATVRLHGRCGATARGQCADWVHARRAPRGGQGGRYPTTARTACEWQAGVDSCDRGSRRRNLPALQQPAPGGMAASARASRRERLRCCKDTRHFGPPENYHRQRTTFPGSRMSCCTRSLTS